MQNQENATAENARNRDHEAGASRMQDIAGRLGAAPTLEDTPTYHVGSIQGRILDDVAQFGVDRDMDAHP